MSWKLLPTGQYLLEVGNRQARLTPIRVGEDKWWRAEVDDNQHNPDTLDEAKSWAEHKLGVR